MENNIINILENKNLEFLRITFRNIMMLQVPRKYIDKLEFGNEPERIVEHYNMGYPSEESVDVETFILNDITMVLDEQYCAKAYSVTASDFFTYIENETHYNYTAKQEIFNNCIVSVELLDKNEQKLYPEYYVAYDTTEDDNWKNIYQKNRIIEGKIEIKIKKE